MVRNDDAPIDAQRPERPKSELWLENIDKYGRSKAATTRAPSDCPAPSRLLPKTTRNGVVFAEAHKKRPNRDNRM
jgi:hypothetical protein